jgi:hypothetical protein
MTGFYRSCALAVLLSVLLGGRAAAEDESLAVEDGTAVAPAARSIEDLGRELGDLNEKAGPKGADAFISAPETPRPKTPPKKVKAKPRRKAPKNKRVKELRPGIGSSIADK